MSSLALLDKSSPFDLNVGALVERALGPMRQDRKGSRTSSVSVSSSSFPFLLERSGAKDCGGFLERHSERSTVLEYEGFRGYTFLSARAAVDGTTGRAPHREVLGLIGARKANRATVCEMLASYLDNQKAMTERLRAGWRFIALGTCWLNFFEGAACLRLAEGELVLCRIPIDIGMEWYPDDHFVMRLR